MKLEENRHALQLEDTSPTNAKTEQEIAALPEPESAEEKLSASARVEPSEAGEAAGELDEVLRPLVDREPEPPGLTPSIAAEPVPALKAKSFFREQPPQLIKVDPYVLRRR